MINSGVIPSGFWDAVYIGLKNVIMNPAATQSVLDAASAASNSWGANADVPPPPSELGIDPNTDLTSNGITMAPTRPYNYDLNPNTALVHDGITMAPTMPLEEWNRAINPESTSWIGSLMNTWNNFQIPSVDLQSIQNTLYSATGLASGAADTFRSVLETPSFLMDIASEHGEDIAELTRSFYEWVKQNPGLFLNGVLAAGNAVALFKQWKYKTKSKSKSKQKSPKKTPNLSAREQSNANYEKSFVASRSSYKRKQQQDEMKKQQEMQRQALIKEYENTQADFKRLQEIQDKRKREEEDYKKSKMNPLKQPSLNRLFPQQQPQTITRNSVKRYPEPQFKPNNSYFNSNNVNTNRNSYSNSNNTQKKLQFTEVPNPVFQQVESYLPAPNPKKPKVVEKPPVRQYQPVQTKNTSSNVTNGIYPSRQDSRKRSILGRL
jgi:hypothetical protein